MVQRTPAGAFGFQPGMVVDRWNELAAGHGRGRLVATAFGGAGRVSRKDVAAGGDRELLFRRCVELEERCVVFIGRRTLGAGNGQCGMGSARVPPGGRAGWQNVCVRRGQLCAGIPRV